MLLPMAGLPDTHRIDPPAPVAPPAESAGHHHLSAANDTTPLPNASAPDASWDGRAPVRPRRGFRAELSRWLMTLALMVAVAVPLVVLSVAGAVIWQARTDQTRPAD